MLGDTFSDHDIGKSADDLGARPAPLGPHQQTLASVLVNQVEDAHTTTIVRSRTYEVVAPHVARMRRPQPHTRAIVEPQAPLGFCLFGTFSPSRRQMRSTRSLLTFQPARTSSAVIRRYP